MTLPPDQRPPIAEVQAEYERARESGNKRAAAELAYALAVRVMAEGPRVSDATRYAKECLELLESLPSETIDDVASQRLSVGGVNLPEYFHDDVVRKRLSYLLDN